MLLISFLEIGNEWCRNPNSRSSKIGFLYNLHCPFMIINFLIALLERGGVSTIDP